jgi:hypothetical protein
MLNAIVIEDAFEMRFLLRLSLGIDFCNSLRVAAIKSDYLCLSDDNYCYLSEPFSLLCSLLLREY